MLASSVVLMLCIKEVSQRRLRVLKCVHRSINLELAGAALLWIWEGKGYTGDWTETDGLVFWAEQ